jgi:DNA-binding NarL/FixJ family response regulator
MTSHILQVAYYPNLQETRALMLKSAGYEVTSVLGNNKAIALDDATIAAADLIVVGFDAPHSVRAEMVLWFKAHYPQIPVVALRSSRWEEFPEANVSTFSEDPTVWLAEIASILQS